MQASIFSWPRRKLRKFQREIFLVVAVLLTTVVLTASNWYLTRQFAESQRIEAQLSATLYAANVQSLLKQHQLVSPILAQDQAFSEALVSGDFSTTSQRLIAYSEEIGARRIFLLDLEGRVVAANDRRFLGSLHNTEAYFTNALRDSGTIFTLTGEQAIGNPLGFHYARKLTANGETLGVMVVTVNMRALEDGWRQSGEMIAVTNSENRIILATNPFWRHKDFDALLAEDATEPGIVDRLVSRYVDTLAPLPFTYIQGRGYVRSDVKVNFRGWQLSYLATLEAVHTQVNAVLALELMALALILALIFYWLSRRAERRTQLLANESRALRELNTRLSEEVAERQRVEESLQDAEQSLEQASKLAALGQMSAAVSHELNQPLAAMRTYLAGARLLVQRRRPEEALSSFQRIDDLLERMGAITRQLKSYARKGGEELAPVNMRDVVEQSLAMMEPQLGQTKISIEKSIPPEPVMVMGNALRLEQILVNLLRNALDAVSVSPDPKIDILLIHGPMVSLRVRDNGTGITDTDALFEPFYTTKKAGEGVGLGLAISAGIAKELGGRLSARNVEPQGALFELLLPRHQGAEAQAAE